MIARISLVAVLSLLVASISFAHDSDRIEHLEIEVQMLKQQVSELQSMLHGSKKEEKFVLAGDGWKSLANWRRLSTGMNETAVRKILGEPERIEGGGLAYWYYKNNGMVSFYNGALNRWEEPR